MNAQEPQFDLRERELVISAQSGDRAAQKSIYKLYRERVHSIVFYSLGEAVFAEDVAQAIFLKIFRALPGFRFESSLATWIYRITVNECLNQNRQSAAQYVPLDAILGSPDEIARTLLPDLEHERSQRQEIIQQAVLGLSPKLRTVVVLKYVEGLSYEEIAEVLDCSVGTVGSRLNRALSGLESRLRPLRRIL